MPVNDPSSILADALKSPDDDAPRMALANTSEIATWHSHLIQVQCDLAQRAANDPFRHEWQVVDHVEQRLLGSLSSFERGFLQLRPNLAVSFRRGFLEVVTAELATILDHGEECLAFALFPFVNRLHLTGDTARIPDLCSSPLLQRIDHLWFAEALCDDRKVKTLSSSSNIGHLKSLNFRFWGECDDKGRLADYGGVISPDGAKALASSSSLRNLQSLDLTFHDLGLHGTQHLTRSTTLQNLETLCLDLNDLGDDGVKELAVADNFTSLASLSVRDNGISLEGIHALISGPRAQGLRSLRLTDNDLGPDAGTVFAKTTCFGRLEYLYLANCSLGDKGFSDLLEFNRLPQLRSLNVDRNSIGPSFFGVFRAAPAIAHISAMSNGISDDNAHHMLAGTGNHSSELRSLNLSDNKLGNGFAQAISESLAFGNLETLHLAGNSVDDIGASYIRQSESLKNLQLVSFDASRVSDQEQRLLVDRFGDGVVFK